MNPNDRRYYVTSLSFLEPVELEVDESASKVPPRPTTPRKAYTAIMHDAVELEPCDDIPVRPATALRLTVQFAPGADPACCQQEFVALLRALDDFDRALGGNELVLDSSLSGGTVDTLTVVLRPRDVHGALDRFTQMAELLGCAPVSRTSEQPPAHLSGEHIAAIASLFAQRGPVETESARDRVQNWRGRKEWLAGLQVELVQGR